MECGCRAYFELANWDRLRHAIPPLLYGVSKDATAQRVTHARLGNPNPGPPARVRRVNWVSHISQGKEYQNN